MCCQFLSLVSKMVLTIDIFLGIHDLSLHVRIYLTCIIELLNISRNAVGTGRVCMFVCLTCLSTAVHQTKSPCGFGCQEWFRKTTAWLQNFEKISNCDCFLMALWFAILEGMIISVWLLSFLVKSILEWLWCDFRSDLYQTKVFFLSL